MPAKDDDLKNLPLQGDTTAPVPAYTCVVYIKNTEAGVSARVANLDMPLVDAATQRGALQQVGSAFKQRLAQYAADEEPIAWIEPPLEIEPSERKLVMPVHL